MSEPIDPREQFGEHGEWDALAVGWALSALDPEDEQRFAEHLPGCARCTATVRESLYTVADLAYALPDETPPASLKARLMAAVAAEPRNPRAAPEPHAPAEPEPEQEWPPGEPHPGSPGYGIDWFARPARAAEPAPDETTRPPAGERSTGPGAERAAGAGGPAGAAGTEEPQPAPEGYRGDTVEGQEAAAEIVALPRRRRVVRWVGIGVAAAAVVALIAGLLVSNVRLRDQKNDLRRIAAQREAAIAELTANGPARVAALTANGQPSPDRRATLVVRGDHIEIIVESLGPTTGNETYWLWTLRCDTPQPTDLKPIRPFTVTQSEFSVRDIGSDPGVASAPCFAISSEEGSATPKAPRQVVAVGQPR